MGTTIGTDVSSAAGAYASKAQGSDKMQSTEKKINVTGKTIGEPKLSDKAAKYYEQLRTKYGNYDFILVSEDQKQNAEANIGKYVNKDRTVVLINEEKVERMAADESYRKKYENILAGAQPQLQQMAAQLKDTPGLKGFGMKVNDNGAASFIAAVDKNATAAAKAQKKRQAKAAEKKAAEKKKAAKEQEEQRAEKRKEKKRTQSEQLDAIRNDRVDDETVDAYDYEEDIEIVSAGSIEELVKKVWNVAYAAMSDNVRTAAERALGGHIDFKG